MIWCFGFFFLELLDDCDEKSNNDDALASLDDADRKLGSDSDSTYPGHLWLLRTPVVSGSFGGETIF